MSIGLLQLCIPVTTRDTLMSEIGLGEVANAAATLVKAMQGMGLESALDVVLVDDQWELVITWDKEMHDDIVSGADEISAYLNANGTLKKLH